MAYVPHIKPVFESIQTTNIHRAINTGSNKIESCYWAPSHQFGPAASKHSTANENDVELNQAANIYTADHSGHGLVETNKKIAPPTSTAANENVSHPTKPNKKENRSINKSLGSAYIAHVNETSADSRERT